MSKRQPLRKIVGTDRAPFVSDHPRFKALEGLGGHGFMLVDVLSCDHELPAKLLLSPSKTPYVNDEEGERWRKCKKCPREESA